MLPSKRHGARILFLLLGLTFGILIAEGALRLFAPSWLEARMNALNLAPNAQVFGSDIGWSVESMNGKFMRFKPDTEMKITYYEYRHAAHIDHLGGRYHSTGDRKRPMIPFLGDSFVFGIGVNDDQAFVSLLNQMEPAYFLNLGVPGSALLQQLEIIRFRHKELGFPPLYVLSFFTGNDYAEIARVLSGEAARAEARTDRQINVADSLLENRLLQRSYLLNYLAVSKGDDPDTERSPGFCCCSLKTPNGRRWNNPLFLMMLKHRRCIQENKHNIHVAMARLNELSARLHFREIFLVIPEKHQVNQALLAQKASAFGLSPGDFDVTIPNRILEEELEQNGISYMDAMDCLEENEAYYYRLDDHFTPEGHEAFARCVQTEVHRWVKGSIVQ